MSPFFLPQCDWVGIWGVHWIHVASASIAIHLTIEVGGYPDSDAWGRAWTAMSILPQSLFCKAAGPQILFEFTRSFRQSWNDSVAQSWARINERSAAELPYEDSIRMLMQSVAFCFDNSRFPLGPVVRASFPAVYDAVATGRATRITDEMFGYFDWDKAKKLRKDLIDAYISSAWPAEQLALIAADCKILGKIVHRLKRSWRGEDYIRKMEEGLRNQATTEAQGVRGELLHIMNSPDFFEPWD